MELALRSTLIFSIIGFLVNFGLGTVAPILPLYALTFNVSIVMVGALVSASAISKVILDMPSGIVADRLGTKRFMLGGLLIVAASAMISAFAVDYWMLLIGLTVQGIGSAIYFTTSYLGISRTAPPAKRGRHLGLFISLQFLGTTSGPVLGGLIGQAYGLSGPFLIYAAFTLISAAMVYFLVSGASIKGAGGASVDLHQITRTFRNYTLTSVNAGLFTTSILRAGLVSTIVPLFAVRNLGLTTVELGAALTLSAGFNFLSLLPASSLSDRLGRKPFLFSSLLFGGIVAAMIPLATDLLTFAVIMSALGFALGLSGSVGAYVTDVAPPPDLGGAMGIFRTMGDLGSFIGPIILTAFIPASAGPINASPFLVAGMILSVSGLLLIPAKDPVRSKAGGRK
ncbi:MFS transporter [Methanomassiliicoccus luminyensis]|nr:MFS transporter [Methanomassiliicoccus luminyensis]